MKDIKLGYELKTGKVVKIEPTHIIVTGITQKSGKTTTLEALIKRSDYKAIVFKTKIGETGFSEGTIVPPYFKEKSDWQYVSSLLEATLKEKLKFERSWIMMVCKNAENLIQVHNNIKEKLANPKIRGLSRGVYTTLDEYFNLILPQLQYARFSRTLELTDGINIMDLEQFKGEIQSLVIRSVLEEVLTNYKKTIVVIPEAWKFLPEKRGNPCKIKAEEFIRQGATNENFLWIDSQDMAGVDKGPLKQVATWILGLQLERNEVKHTLDQIPLPNKSKPKAEEIMSLKLGHFIIATPEYTKNIYVQPIWLDDNTARQVAKGKKNVKDVQQPKVMAPYGVKLVSPQVAAPDFEAQKFYAKVQQDLVELRQDFFTKISQLDEKISNVGSELFKLQTSKQEINKEEIVSLVLQKMPTPTAINKDAIVAEVLSKVPRMSGAVTYEVAPLEKITKSFLEEAKQKILNDVNQLDDEQKRILKFVETQQKGCSQTFIIEKCLYQSSTSGGTRSKVSKKTGEMTNLQLVRKDRNAVVYPNLKERLKELLEPFSANEQEIEQVYNHILAEMLK